LQTLIEPGRGLNRGLNFMDNCRQRAARTLPSALEHINEISARLSGRMTAVFLDYDGTLTPIVLRPEDAELSETMRRVIRRLAKQCPVAVVSGRDLQDVREMVGIERLHYAGSHGFDIMDPEGLRHEHPAGTERLSQIEKAEQKLQSRLSRIRGCRVERKKFAVAVHYREVADQDVPAVEDAIKAVHQNLPGLRLSGGKKIFELQPEVDWHKGRAVRWLIKEALNLGCSKVVPIYIGDDVTDEDAFRELRDDGIGILVDDAGLRESAARYRLRNPQEVKHFLSRLTDRLKREDDLRDCFDSRHPPSQ
jgi:trehalose 6-phosphate phosphatase